MNWFKSELIQSIYFAIIDLGTYHLIYTIKDFNSHSYTNQGLISRLDSG